MDHGLANPLPIEEETSTLGQPEGEGFFAPLSAQKLGAASHVEALRNGHPLPEILEIIERELIAHAYREANEVKLVTARKLGIKPSALYYKLAKYGLLEKAQSAG
jgi:DNA-binding NtrC family response regulator